MEKYKNLLEKGCCNFEITDSKTLQSLEELSKSEHFESKNWKFLRWAHYGIQFESNEVAIDFIQEYKELKEPSQVYFQYGIGWNESVHTKTISDVILQFKEIFTQHLGHSNVTDDEIITMIKNSEQNLNITDWSI